MGELPAEAPQKTQTVKGLAGSRAVAEEREAGAGAGAPLVVVVVGADIVAVVPEAG